MKQCKLWMCQRDRAEKYLYCEQHKGMGEKIEPVEKAVEGLMKTVLEDERDTFIKGTNYTMSGKSTVVDEELWDYYIQFHAHKWDVPAEEVEDRGETELASEFKFIDFA